MTDDAFNEGTTRDQFDRLYTPWRLNYVRGERASTSCVFCSMRDSSADTDNFVLDRGSDSYVVMNLFPYNTGHLLIVPNEHVASPEDLPRDVLHEMADHLQRALRIIRHAIGPDAFNTGFNLGSQAGAGIAAHLHEHIVPRWSGDANFMSIVGNTRVLPELLSVTYAKLRAEYLSDVVDRFALHLFDLERTHLLVDPDTGGVPLIQPVDGEPIWRTALSAVQELGLNGQITLWAEGPGAPAFEIQTDSTATSANEVRWQPVERVQTN